MPLLFTVATKRHSQRKYHPPQRISTIIHDSYRWNHESKVYLWLEAPYTATQHRSNHSQGVFTMAATRRFLADAVAAVRSFSIELYAAHGGWAPAVRG